MTHSKGKTVYLSSPIDVVFYSASQNATGQSIVATVEEKNETFDVIEQEYIKEEAKTAEEVKTKEDAVVKKKEKSKKIDKEKSNIQPKKNIKKADKKNIKKADKKNIKKADKKTVKQLKTKKSEGISKISGNNSNIETSQSSESKVASVSVGSQSVGLSFGPQNFKFSYYGGQIVRKIGSQWRWAESYGSLRVVVYFKISRDGSVSDILVKESSVSVEYDRNALDTIRRAAPFPVLPEDYSDESLGVFLEFKCRN
ncbi:MAG: cell envelope integrity protein TolA [Endomicrobium sp.]|uniref:cell envelope integrity protein TolA n=1 Tax=Candidatus Endomicrobiellum pyrsonymphae TaxID=1408203 RepID=UPI003582E4BA|nr:cell envelope integrity protein TolA [Endomicrobium sp.]